MVKNPIKMVRNPNSPAAIQARLNGQPDPTVPDKLHLLTDVEAGRIFIDLTKSEVDQAVGYVVTGGPYTHNRRLVKSTTNRDHKTGKLVMTNYFTDLVTRQWIIIRGFIDAEKLPGERSPSGSIKHPVPRATYGNFFAGGIYVGAPGANWRNLGRSVDKIREAQKRIHSRPTLDPDANRDVDHPRDRYEDDFTGQF